MLHLLYHRRSNVTGRKFARLLGIGAYRADSSRRLPPGNSVCLLRWGSAQGSTNSLIQQAAAIATAGNKLAALRAMQTGGVRVPEFALEPNPDWGRYLSRRSHGFGGTDIVVLPTGMGDTHADGDFYTKFIPNEREYRIHVAFGEVIRVQRKYLDYPEQHDNSYIKNYAQGYRFRTPTRRLNSDRIDAAIHAVGAIGLDFGAVDLVIGSEDNEAYVLEVNTAPKLAPLTARQYAEAIRARAGELGHVLEINEGVLSEFCTAE